MVKRTRTLEELGIDRGWLMPTGEITLTGPADVCLNFPCLIAPPLDFTFFADDGGLWVTVTLNMKHDADRIETLLAQGFKQE